MSNQKIDNRLYESGKRIRNGKTKTINSHTKGDDLPNISESQIEHNTNGRVVTIGLGGLVAILLSLFLETFRFQEYIQIGVHFIRDAGIAFLSAALIAYAIEIPSLLNFFKNRIIDALKDDGYLHDLSNADLSRIKNNCNKHIFSKLGKRPEAYLNESLIDFGNQIFNLLMKPYYEYCITNIICTDCTTEDKNCPSINWIKKTVKTNQKIVNPIKGEAEISVLGSVNFSCPEDFPNCGDLNKITKFQVKIDEENFIDLTDHIITEIEDLKSIKHPHYNKKLTYKLHGKDDVSFTFLSDLIIEMEEERYVISADRLYTRRVDRPTKNFTLTYMYDNPRFGIKSDCFSTLPNLQPNNLIKSEHGNSIFLESRSWLLPGNGIIVTIVPNEKVLPQNFIQNNNKDTIILPSQNELQMPR